MFDVMCTRSKRCHLASGMISPLVWYCWYYYQMRAKNYFLWAGNCVYHSWKMSKARSKNFGYSLIGTYLIRTRRPVNMLTCAPLQLVERNCFGTRSSQGRRQKYFHRRTRSHFQIPVLVKMKEFCGQGA